MLTEFVSFIIFPALSCCHSNLFLIALFPIRTIIFFLPHVICFFPLASFKVFSLSVILSLIMMFPNVVFRHIS